MPSSWPIAKSQLSLISSSFSRPAKLLGQSKSLKGTGLREAFVFKITDLVLTA